MSAAIPYAVLDAVASAIERARCHGREGPYGGYDYGHNTDFYGPEPEGGRYVVRDFRDAPVNKAVDPYALGGGK